MWLGLTFVVVFAYCVLRRDVVVEEVAKLFRKRFSFEVFRAFISSLVLVIGCVAALASGASVPLATRIILVLVALAFAGVFFPYREKVVARLRSCRKDDISMAVSGVFWALMFLALYLSSRHIVAEGGELTLVRSPIPVTTTAELFMHWGFHLTIIIVASLLLFAVGSLLELFLAGALLILAGLYDKGALVVFLLIGFQLIRLVSRPQCHGKESTWRDACADALLLGGLGLILMPEIVFLDDPYGGENERMNTIFKMYETAWALLALGGVGLLHRARCAYVEPQGHLWLGPGLALSVISIAVSLNFLIHSIPMRKMLQSSNRDASEGLFAPDSEHSGAGTVIRALRVLPRGRVLEAQGNAYSYTSFVSTLAAQPSYLGWSNHVNLLTRQYDEVGRREKKTEQIYLETDCSRRKSAAQEENISYIVIGTLEKVKYQDIGSKDFSCFTKIIEEGEYTLYSP